VGTTVVIAGISLAQTSQVTIGGKLVTSFSVNSDKQVTATVPAGALTGQKITVTTTGAPGYSPTTFTLTP
jgi:large repetitive protein